MSNVKVVCAFDKLQVRFHHKLICTTNTRPVADSVAVYLDGVDTGAVPGPDELAAIKREVSEVMLKADPRYAAACKCSS